MELYNVYIAKVSTFKAVQRVGSGVSYSSAKAIENDSMEGVNTLKYFPVTVPVGSDRDLELDSDL